MSLSLSLTMEWQPPRHPEHQGCCGWREGAQCYDMSSSPTDVSGGASRAWFRLGALAVILLVAAALRVPGLTSAPPGLNQDEAANAWNAWCLLKTGHDAYGVTWPIFYMRALGENRCTSYMYLVVPFQALGGLNVWTTRLPAAVGGVVTVLLVYWIASRLSDRVTGLAAAALLALNPWHIQLSRLGLEASIVPLQVAAGLAAVLWARLPPGDAQRPTVWWKALAAGLIAGAACYGYPAARLFLPLLLAGLVLVTAAAWWRLARTRRGALAVGAFGLGFAVTFGPLLYQHIAHPELIGRRAMIGAIWEDVDSPAVRAGKVLTRYADHFGLDFLFVAGDRHEMQWPSGFGALSWYVLPLLLTGIGVSLVRARRSSAARLLLLLLVLYPVGDCLYKHDAYFTADGVEHMSLNVLRSAPGLVGLMLLAAVGLVAAGRAVAQRVPRAAIGVAVASVTVAFVLDARFVLYFFGAHTQQPVVQHDFCVDLMTACQWLRPRFAAADAVFITGTDYLMPYIVTLVGLDYDPQRWFHEPREMRTYQDWEHFVRIGKMRFLYEPPDLAAVKALQQNGRPDHVILIMRPHEARMPNPSEVIYLPNGRPALVLYDLTM